ncbi:TspO/MBR family protein [Sphingomonas oligophenolica]|uniref:Tryptophan-rich sensory protein n=1 Tax=Sphingomonas oligophenolica TaxID=301154 RepID=A0A502CNQ6_9SPHN|nr:TspO/MBR family protein [Sphingomonas oligophenolica]TPG13759.1 tryptophan-rich sensory protein [Sphingomonas oligophenolica]
MTETIAAVAWALVLGGAGGVLTEIGAWYHGLKKPSFQPPSWLFGPAWTIILGLAAWAGVLAWRAAPTAAAHTDVILFFAVNGILHLLWSPLFFKWKRPDWSLIEVVFLWVSVGAMMLGLGSLSSLAGWLIVPYFVWVSFAAVLNRAIVRLNQPFGHVA